MSVQTNLNESKDGGPARESNISKELEYTDTIYVACGEKLSADAACWSYLKNHLPGVGRVDLVSISATVVTSKAGDHCYVGTSAVGSSATAGVLGRARNGVSVTANTLNLGTKIIADIVPLSNVSMQLFPTSADLPEMRLVFDKTASCAMDLAFDIKVRGVRVQYVDLN